MDQQTLFEGDCDDVEIMRIPNAELRWFKCALTRDESDTYLAALLRDTPWRHDKMSIHGKTIPLPRLQAWYSDEHHRLNYSGMRIPPLAWTTELLSLRSRVSALTGRSFNGVLVTLYRNGQDSVGWHSDNETEWGEYPVIASLSFGAAREFQLKHLFDRSQETVRIELTHGSLLVMGETVQKYWKHQLPKRKRVSEPRINLTFRNMLAPSD